jgi:hypothetical protein
MSSIQAFTDLNQGRFGPFNFMIAVVMKRTHVTKIVAKKSIIYTFPRLRCAVERTKPG